MDFEAYAHQALRRRELCLYALIAIQAVTLIVLVVSVIRGLHRKEKPDLRKQVGVCASALSLILLLACALY